MPRKPGVPIRIDADVAERLEVEADARTVSTRWLASRLLREGLDRLIPADELRFTRDDR